LKVAYVKQKKKVGWRVEKKRNPRHGKTKKRKAWSRKRRAARLHSKEGDESSSGGGGASVRVAKDLPSQKNERQKRNWSSRGRVFGENSWKKGGGGGHEKRTPRNSVGCLKEKSIDLDQTRKEKKEKGIFHWHKKKNGAVAEAKQRRHHRKSDRKKKEGNWRRTLRQSGGKGKGATTGKARSARGSGWQRGKRGFSLRDARGMDGQKNRPARLTRAKKKKESINSVKRHQATPMEDRQRDGKSTGGRKKGAKFSLPKKRVYLPCGKGISNRKVKDRIGEKKIRQPSTKKVNPQSGWGGHLLQGGGGGRPCPHQEKNKGVFKGKMPLDEWRRTRQRSPEIQGQFRGGRDWRTRSKKELVDK